MQFLYHFIAIIFSGYLGFTNLLAVQIGQYFVTTTGPNTVISTTTTSTNRIAALPSNYVKPHGIPDILHTSQAYQAAAIIGSTNTITQTTKDPLEALVNIYCTFTTKTYIRTTTGSGFFVSQNGVILTNAHVAQFFLLEKADVSGKTECTVRTGDPATPKYTAELLYIPPTWIQAHAALIDDQNPTGTGERDYALLYVNATVDGTPLPVSFPSLGTDTNLLPQSITGVTVTTASYPAEALFKDGNTNLKPKKATGSIAKLYTFGSNDADVFSITGSAIGQHGSSGGPIETKNGNVIGMITTKGDGADSIRAITLSYINRTITQETGFSFASNISGDLPYRAKVFTDTLAPFLAHTLAIQVNKDNNLL